MKQPVSTPKQVQKLSYTSSLILTTLEASLAFLLPKLVQTAWQLHVYSHLTTLETTCQHTKTSAEVELHVDSHLTTLESAWQHTKTSAELELHIDSH